MAYKIAFASSDGKVVNQHFGRAKQFHIVEIGENEYKFIESRENIPPCDEFGHSDDALANAIQVISDCKAVFVSQIGPGAAELLEQNGIQPVEAPDEIEKILERLIKSKVRLIR